MTAELKNIIQTLTSNIQEIKSLHNKVLKENEELKGEITELLAKLDLKEKENEEFTKKYESLKLAKTIAASSSDAHDAKVKLNRIVREIDKCISLLNK